MTAASQYQLAAGEVVQCPRCHYIRSSRDFGATEACPPAAALSIPQWHRPPSGAVSLRNRGRFDALKVGCHQTGRFPG